MNALTPDKYLSDAAVNKILAYVRDASKSGSRRACTDRLIIELLLGTGLRAQEACNLRLGDLPASHGKPCIWVRHGKGDVAAAVLISPSLEQLLSEYHRAWRAGLSQEYPLFDNGKGGPMQYRTLYNKVVKIGGACGMVVYPHMLRHTYACRLYKVEKDLIFVQSQLRHADPTTTSRYAKTANVDGMRQLQKLDQVCGSVPEQT